MIYETYKNILTIIVAILINGCGKGDEVLTPNQRTENLLKAQVWELNGNQNRWSCK